MATLLNAHRSLLPALAYREPELLHELSLARELQNVPVIGAVAADPDDPLGVDDDAVVGLRPLEARPRAAPGVHHVALLVELDDRRRRQTAIGRRRVGRRVDFLSVERARAAVNDPDVILRIDADADDVPKQPVVGQRFGPHRIDFESRRLHAFFGGGRPVEHGLGEAENHEDNKHGGADRQIAFHQSLPFARDPRPGIGVVGDSGLGVRGWGLVGRSATPSPTPHSLLPTPYSLRPTPYALSATTYSPNPQSPVLRLRRIQSDLLQAARARAAAHSDPPDNYPR